MKNPTFRLKGLKVQSFVTSVKEERIKGGNTNNNCNTAPPACNSDCCPPNSGVTACNTNPNPCGGGTTNPQTWCDPLEH